MPEEKPPIRTHHCNCGQMRWRIAPEAKGSHVVCYCADCQTYANTLNHGATRVDSDGGTEIFQTLPVNFEFLSGKEHLAVMRLGPKGILRWYAGCCGTPVANTLPSPGLPFLGAVLPPGTTDYGPVTSFLSTVGTAPHIKETGVLAAYMSVMARAIGGVVSGRKRTTPFFNDDKTPIAVPRVLSPAERSAARPN